VIGEVIANRYELEELCGTGGMSSVFRAYDRQLERSVALKVLHEQFADDGESVERFRREARSAAQLSHPHIVTVIDRGADAGRQFIVFEYVDGENLKQLVGRSGRLPLARALELSCEVAEGLAFAHANGLVHRDVKPQNILVNGEGAAKVTDFGIARSLDAEHGVTLTGTVLGTSTYLSPEQASGQPVTPATDVYSLGVVLWELLTGDVPFPGDNFVSVALRHINERPPDLRSVRPDVTPRLAAAVRRALAKDAEARFPTMDAFAAELHACLDELAAADSASTLVGAAAPIPLRPHPAPRDRTGAGGRRVLVLTLVGFVVLAAVVASVVGLGDLGGGGSAPRSPGAASTVAPSGSAPVALHAVGNYDPSGPADTHADTAGRATDGDPSTSWYTQIYATPAFGGLKDGIGLVLDAGGDVTPSELTLTTPTPGFTALVRAGDASSGPFSDDSATQTVSGTTTFRLLGTSARYYVVWITKLPPGGKAEISEVAAKS
jgi:predicted Ser/Thr protein kinase